MFPGFFTWIQFCLTKLLLFLFLRIMAYITKPNRLDCMFFQFPFQCYRLGCERNQGRFFLLYHQLL